MPRAAATRALGPRALLPAPQRRGLVWAPDLHTARDPVTGFRGTLDGSTHNVTGDFRLFNGTTDRIDWANVRDFGTSPLPSSGAMWIYPTSVGAGLFHMFTVASTAPAQSIIFRRSADALDFAHSYSTTGVRRVSTAVLTVNTWAHVGYSYDGGGASAGIHLYINGAEVGSYVTNTEPVGTPRAADGVWSLGGRVETDTNNFAGRIHRPMVWDRVLGAAEFAALARAPRPD